MTVDYADDNVTISNINESETVELNDTTVVNGTYYVGVDKEPKNMEVDRVVSFRPTISLWAKPSVRSGYAYKWYYRTWVDYCPNCHHYGCLLVNPKGVPERELTCARCDSDFCGVTGKEKYSWSNKYLRRA